VVTCEVLEVKESGIEVKIAGTDFTTFIKRSELAGIATISAPSVLRWAKRSMRG